MKKLSLLLSTLSFIGVIVLSVLYYTDKQVALEDKALEEAVDSLTANQLSFPVAYVEMDSILKNYKFVQKIQQELQSQYKTAEASFQSKAKAHQKKVLEFQKDVNMLGEMQQQGAFTEQQLISQQQSLQHRQQKLAANEQKLAELQQKLQLQLGENQAKLNNEMALNIQNFLKKYSTELNYTYVMVKGPGSSVWFGADSLDISSKLIDVLNAEFEASENEANASHD